MTPRRVAPPGATLAVVVAVVALVAGACSGDDDAAATTPSVAVPPSRSAPSTSTAAAPASTVDPFAETTFPIDPALTEAPPSSTVDRGPTPSDELAAALPVATDLGLPDGWVTTDLDPSVAIDPALASDLDPFLGLVRCADGVLRKGPDDVWAERRIVGPGVPDGDGLLGARTTIEREDDAAYAAHLEGVAACTPSSEQVLVERAVTTIPTATGDVEGQRVHISAAATEAVPFPSSFDYVIAHAGDTTVSVLLWGLDVGQDWASRSDEVAGRILDQS